MDSNYKPSQRQQNCVYSFPYNGEKMNQTICMNKKNKQENSINEAYVTNEECEVCECYNS